MSKQKETFDKLGKSDLMPLNKDLFHNLSVEELEVRLETGCGLNYACDSNDGCGANDGGGESEEEIKDSSSN